MPLLRQIPSENARGPQTALLTIIRKIFFQSKKPFFSFRFAYRFSQIEFIVTKPTDILQVKLVPHRSIRGYAIQIHEHCCTRPAAMEYMSTQHPPIYKPGQQVASYQLSLVDRELVQIGVIVRVFKDGKYKGDILCDPQVGNGPPPQNGFIPVDLLEL